MSQEIPAPPGGPDEQAEKMVGTLLRTGVILAGVIVLTGGILYLVRDGSHAADHHTFRGEPAELRQPLRILEDALTMDSRGIIQLGLLLLVATPVARVVLMFFVFLRQRDFLYVAVTVIVLGVLCYGILGRAPGGT